MLERRVIPFGEKMTERHCRLAGYVGQIAVMTNLGAFYERQILTPTTNRHSDRLRDICKDFNQGKYLDVESKLLDGYDDLLMDTSHKIGFIRSGIAGGRVLDGDAEAALEYHAGQADFRLPQNYVQPFGRLIDYMTARTIADIQVLDSINRDDSDQETHYVARSNGEIAYEAKYLEPDTAL